MLTKIAETLVALEGLSRSGLAVRIIGEAEEDDAVPGQRIWFAAEFMQKGADEPMFIVDFKTQGDVSDGGKDFISVWNVLLEYERFFTEELSWKQALKQLRWICKQVEPSATEMFVVSTKITVLYEGSWVVQTHGPFVRETAERKAEELQGRYENINALYEKMEDSFSWRFAVEINPLTASATR